MHVNSRLKRSRSLVMEANYRLRSSENSQKRANSFKKSRAKQACRMKKVVTSMCSPSGNRICCSCERAMASDRQRLLLKKNSRQCLEKEKWVSRLEANSVRISISLQPWKASMEQRAIQKRRVRRGGNLEGKKVLNPRKFISLSA